MSLFNNNKLFLNFNPDSLADTPKEYSFDELVLNKVAAEELNLDKIIMLFIKDKVTTQDKNAYFETTFNIPNYEFQNTAIRSDLSSFMHNEKSSYEKNKILKYSEIPIDSFILEHDFHKTNFASLPGEEGTDNFDLSKGLYTVRFTDENLLLNLLNFYRHNKSEEFKFCLQGYDSKNNLIDSTDIIVLKGKTYNTPIKLEYVEIISRFKSILRNSVDLQVTSNGFKIKNHEDTFATRFSLNNQSDVNKLFTLKDLPSTLNNSDFNAFQKRWPHLNNAYAHFILSQDLAYDVREDNNGEIFIITKGLREGYRTPWLFGGNADFSSIVTIIDGHDGHLNPDEIDRFELKQNNTNTISPTFSYVDNSGNIHEIRFNPISWETEVSFFESDTDFIGVKHSSFKQALLQDYNNNEIDTFNFLIEVPYILTSYIQEWDEDFKEVTLHELSRSDLSELINNLYFGIFRQEIHDNFEITKVPIQVQDLPLSIQMNIKDTTQQNSIFFGTDVEESKKPRLLDILRRTSLTDSISTLDENQRIFNDSSLNESLGFVNLGTNISFEDLVGGPYYYQVRGASAETEEIFGEFLLKIVGYYQGEEIYVYYPVDIAEGFSRLQRNSFLEKLLPENNFVQINFKDSDSKNSLIRNFDLKFKKDKVLDFYNNHYIEIDTGETTIESPGDTELKDFLSKIIFEIDFIQHNFIVTTVDRGTESFSILKSPLSLKNFSIDVDQIEKIGEQDQEFFKVKDFLSNRNQLKIGTLPSSILGDNRRIINYFIQEDQASLFNISNFSSISYNMKVKIRNFVLPKLVNSEYSMTIPNDISKISYNNIGTYNNNITDRIKKKLFDIVYENNPSSRNHTNIVANWLSRRFTTNENDYHNKCNSVKNYFFGESSGYYTFTDDVTVTNTISEVEEYATSIQNCILDLDGDHRYKISTDNNVNNILSLELSSTVTTKLKVELPPDHLRATRSGVIYGKISMEVDRFNKQIRQNVTADLPPTPQPPDFSLRCNSEQEWKLEEIKDIKISFVPEVVPWNLNSKAYRSLAKKDGNRTVFKTSYTTASYSISEDNKTLLMNLPQNPSHVFDINKIFNVCNSQDAQSIISNTSPEAFLTRKLIENTRDISKSFYSRIADTTLIVRNFFYRIKIKFMNNKTLFINYRVPLYTSGQENLVKFMKRDPLRILSAKNDFVKSTGQQMSIDQENMINNGSYGSNMYLNLAFLAYARQTVSVSEDVELLKFVYTRLSTLKVAGYKSQATATTGSSHEYREDALRSKEEDKEDKRAQVAAARDQRRTTNGSSTPGKRQSEAIDEATSGRGGKKTSTGSSSKFDKKGSK